MQHEGHSKRVSRSWRIRVGSRPVIALGYVGKEFSQDTQEYEYSRPRDPVSHSHIRKFSYPYPSEGRWNENHNHRKLIKLITWTTALSNSMKLWAMLCRATQDGCIMVESSGKKCSTGEGNGKPLQYSCLENPMNSQFSSVTQSCPTLCEPMDCSTPGLPVLHQLLDLAQTLVHWVSDAIQPSHPLLSPSPPKCLGETIIIHEIPPVQCNEPPSIDIQALYQI